LRQYDALLREQYGVAGQVGNLPRVPRKADGYLATPNVPLAFAARRDRWPPVWRVI